MKNQGYLSLLLHAHLPFVRHPEYDEFLEEDWLYEAITETYIPLLRMMERLWTDGIGFRLTMSMTPPLCEMLADPLLQERYLRKLESLLELSRAQLVERRGTPYEPVAQMYVRELSEARRAYEERWNRQLLPVFRSFQDRGRLEIITCGATHGFLPLMATDEARWAQVEVAVRNYQKHFGRPPRGIWLPECAYAPGLERHLALAGIRWFCTEDHGLLHGSPAPRFGTARPVFTPSGVAVFGRDKETSEQVWSAQTGYPGDPAYREFYRDLGHDLPYAQVRPYLHSDGVRRHTGLKFHRITGAVPLDEKEPYQPAMAVEKAAEHAGNFLFNRQAQLRWLGERHGLQPHLMAPYDAELYGHWWFEGPIFLEMLLRKAACDQDEVGFVTPSEYLQEHRVHQQVRPALSSWGAKGYFEVWLNDDNDWIYPHLHCAEERMAELARRHPNAQGLQRRALAQAGRELLLAQSSDWAFIITQKTTVPYAEKRTRDHLGNFIGLYEQIMAESVDETWLAELEWKNSIFQELDHMAWHPQRCAAQGGGSAVESVAR